MTNAILFQSAILFAMCGQHAVAWEIALEAEVSTTAAVVRLGDVGQVTGLAGADARTLEQIVLAPGPSRSYSRTLSASQIRKILRGRGVELDGCRFTGPSRSVITHAAVARSTLDAIKSARTRGVAEPANPWKVVRPASYRAQGGIAMVARVKKELASIASIKLQDLSRESTPWNVDITISSNAFRDLPTEWQSLTVEGLDAATDGTHQLVACFASDSGDVRVPLSAVVTRMVELVVPVRPLKRGDVITSRDVELRPVAGRIDRRKVAQRLEEVVGRQVELPLRVGEPMPIRSIKKPILVKRREEVEVIARRGGVRVRTKVRALDEGGRGDAVTVERLDGSRTRFVARVVGVQQVEVCASSASSQRFAER